jgi:uncharacterized protein (DUF58 family)
MLGAWVALGVLAAVMPSTGWLWWLAGAAVLALSLLDLGWLRATPLPPVGRRLPGAMSVGAWTDVHLRVENSGRRTLRVRLFDHHPAAAEIRGLPRTLRVAVGGWAEASYALRPLERGEHHFGHVQLLLGSPFGLWWRNCMRAEAQAVRVYPNFAEVAKYTLFATDHRLSQLGIRKRRRRGEGLEFHQLREYREGDPLRQIDWKATSRLKRLISRDYQDERDQQVVFLIDCGRRMLAKDGELSHFDHALNAMLLLSYVALRQGDAVGFMSFAGTQRFLPPLKGAPSVNVVLNAVYDLQATLHAPDYAQAATELLQRLRKRSLVVLLTNLRDEDETELQPAIALLRRRHLVLVASLQEQAINRACNEPVRGFEDALRLAAANAYLADRRRAHEALEQHRASMLDVEPQQLPVALVNRYLDIKLSGRL